MHALGMVLIWAAIQVTVICSMIFLLVKLAGKTEPLWRSKIIQAGLFAALLVSAFAVSPWPCWSDYWMGGDLTAAREPSEPPALAGVQNSADAEFSQHRSANNTAPKNDVELQSPLLAGLSAFVEQLKNPAPVDPEHQTEAEPAAPAFTVSSAIAFLVLAGIGIGFLRLLAGIWLLRREVARSSALCDVRIQSAIEMILGSQANVEVRVTNKLQSAATTGIFRPVILLPAVWSAWTDEELNAVLAHELNHIRRKDCLTALCAELTRIVYFYHPLMHWLANRLRLEQELAADAEAARFLGGQKRYLCILAEMALNQSSRAPLWPARAFLPSHRTFMRRIEMLKNNPIAPGRGSRWSRCAALGVIALATVFALGLRGTGRTATAQDKPALPESGNAQAEDKQTERKPFPLTYVPDDAIAVFAFRPNELIAKPALKPLAEAILKDEHTAKPLGIPVEQIEQVVLSVGMQGTRRLEPGVIAVMVQSTKALNLESLKQQLTPNSETAFYGGQLYLRQAGGDRPGFWLADEHTLIFSDTERGLKQAIDARNLSVNREKRIPAWAPVSNEAAAFYANVGQVRSTVEGPRMIRGGFGMPPVSPQEAFHQSMGLNPMFAPLWNDVKTVTGRLDFAEGIEVKISAQSDEQGAVKVKETLDALLVLGRNMVDQNRQMIGQLPRGEQEAIGGMLTMAQEVLKTLKVEEDRSQVIVEAKLPEAAANLVVQSMIPAVLSARTAARRSQAMNQLKQIGIAMHNYHDVHKSFPAPVMIGPDGETTHSWRVAILPYLDQKTLYDQYKFDEPWDSEHNKKLLAKIPDIFRHPLDKDDSTNTSFFALVGKNTLMGEGKLGMKLHDVTDGTSNTLMIVEAQRDIPWTKPEDISYPQDRSKALPTLGEWFKGGFLAVLGDGSVNFISSNAEKATLQNLIERNDRNPIDSEELYGPPPGSARPRPPGGSRFGSASENPVQPPASPGRSERRAE